jgi:hypothetical protein
MHRDLKSTFASWRDTGNVPRDNPNGMIVNQMRRNLKEPIAQRARSTWTCCTATPKYGCLQPSHGRKMGTFRDKMAPKGGRDAR